MNVFAALLTRISNSGKLFQVTSLFKAKTKVANLSPYGFFYYPPNGSKVVMIPDMWNSYYGIAFKDSVIPTLKEKEVAVGNFADGSYIKFDENGNIDITCTGNKTVTVSGNCTINVTGNASVSAANISATATTSASVIAPISTVTSTTSCTVTTPIANINSASINLGTSATLGVARLGDTVDLVPASPTYGQIITASTNTRSI